MHLDSAHLTLMFLIGTAIFQFGCADQRHTASNKSTPDAVIGEWIDEVDVGHLDGSTTFSPSYSIWTFTQSNEIHFNGSSPEIGYWTIDDGNLITTLFRDQTNPTPSFIVPLSPKGDALLYGYETPYFGDHASLVLRKLDDNEHPVKITGLHSDVPLPMVRVSDVKSIRLRNDRLAGFTYTTRRLELTRNKAYWQGEVLLTVDDGTGNGDVTTTYSVSVPTKLVEQAIMTLARVPIENGSYQPAMSWLSVYTSLEIFLETNDIGWLQFTSKSQGPNAIPWKVNYNGGRYRSFSDDIMLAFELLDPYLHQVSVEDLLDQ